MDKEELIKDLKDAIKNAKTVDDIYGVFFTMLESKMSDIEICEVLKDMKLPNEILTEINKEENVIEKQVR